MKTCPQCDSSHPGNQPIHGVLRNEIRTGIIARMLLALLLGAMVLPALSQHEEGPILIPKKPVATASVMVICDLACNWILDGEAKGRIAAGGSAKANIVLGQHIVAAATLDGLDKVEKETDIKAAGQTIVRIELKPVRAARLKPGQAAREKPIPAAGPTLLVICDLACNWKLDGVERGHIAAGASATANVVIGQHLVIAATEDGVDQVKQLSEAKSSGQTVVSIELRPVRDARLKAEQQARDKADQDARDKAAQEARDKAAREQEGRELAARKLAMVAWTDPASGLAWTKTDNGLNVNWSQANAYCANLRLGGYSDWRLPTSDELQGIYDASDVGGFHVKVNPDCWYWSSTQKKDGEAWRFILRTGERYSGRISGSLYDRALCVRRSVQ